MKNTALYLIPTPIGNLADMTYRAVQTLQDVDFIYAEDTRTSRVLLRHYQIETPVRSYHKFNEKARCEEIISLLKAGKDIAIISDAGTPGISDPSNIIVSEAIQHNITICPLPGASAVLPALVASGFDTSQFYMVGFLPVKAKERDILLSSLKTLKIPIVFYESPHRISKFLNEIKIHFGNADISIARELTKIYESFYRGKLDDILRDIDAITLKGEFVVVAVPAEIKSDNNRRDTILHLYQTKYHTEKLSNASKKIADELNLSKNIVYQILVECVIKI